MDYNKILKKVKPSEKEQLSVERFLAKVLQKVKEFSGLPSFCVGSVGKGTWLKGDHDIDLFVVFPKSTSREELEKRGLLLGKKVSSAMKGKIQIKYAEHPYVRFYKNNFAVDIVPCYEMKMGEHIQSAVDRSPLHLQYVKKHITGKENETRLLKRFCKAASIYGSDAKHLGISGYVCELLIIKYGSFESAVREIARWQPGVVINLDNQNIDLKKFREHPLIVIDPVDTERNAAAVMSGENFVKLASTAQQFLKKPSEEFFELKEPLPLTAKDIKRLEARGTNFIAVVLRRPDIIDDIAYPQARRLADRIESLLEYNEFLPLHVIDYANEKIIALLIEMEVWKLPNVKKMEGPPIFSKKHSDEFIGKYRDAFVCGTRWYAETERKYKTAIELIADFFNPSEAKLLEAGVPKHLLKEARKAKILEGKNFWSLVKKNKGLSAQMREKYV